MTQERDEDEDKEPSDGQKLAILWRRHLKWRWAAQVMAWIGRALGFCCTLLGGAAVLYELFLRRGP